MAIYTNFLTDPGISYIESVSPTHQMLEEAWNKAHQPKEVNRSKNRKRMRMMS